MSTDNNRTEVLKGYFSQYLLVVRGLSESSVNHYLDALSNVSRRLNEKGLVEENIYEIKELEQLFAVRNILNADEDFINLNKRGNNMYTAGLNNYCKFAEGEGFNLVKEKVTQLDIPLEPESPSVIEQIVHKRSSIIRMQAITLANYKCEIDNRHESFIAENTKRQYMEGHHAIPMKLQTSFEHSLDVYANIICLCPICHRRIHYGLKEDKRDMLKSIYCQRAERLSNNGIVISESELISIFNE